MTLLIVSLINLVINSVALYMAYKRYKEIK